MTNTNPDTGIRYGTIYANNLNTNPDTGIRYGVVYANNLNQDLLQDLLYRYGEDKSYKEAAEDHYKEARAKAERLEDFDADEFDDWYECPDFDIDEPTYSGVFEGVEYQVTWLSGAMLLWVFNSPHVGLYDLCSPCAPNAGNLDRPNLKGYVCYTIPEDWLHK